MTLDNFTDLQGKALERLTEDRRQSGSLGEDVEEMLNAVGVYWDMIEEEFGIFDEYQDIPQNLFTILNPKPGIIIMIQEENYGKDAF